MTHEQELIAAIKKADLDSVERLIKEGADLNYKDEDKTSYGFTWPLLHHCIFKGGSSQSKKYTEIAELLLQNGASIEAVNFTGETPALFAVKYFAFDILDLLVKSGANIHGINNNGQNAFDIVLDRYYYDQRLDEDHIGDEEDEAVKTAIRKGEGESLTRMLQRVDALVKNGYDLNTGEYSAAFSTLLEIAENKLPTKALLYLFDKGANPRENIKSKDGESHPLFNYACNMKLPVKILEAMANKIGLNYIFEQYDDFDTFTIAIINNNLALVKRLVQLGADIHAQDELPLVTACDMGYQKIVEYLVEQGANINFVDAKGKTAITYAEEGGFTEIADYLRSKL
jgi:ankyrin repeat protein